MLYIYTRGVPKQSNSSQFRLHGRKGNNLLVGHKHMTNKKTDILIIINTDVGTPTRQQPLCHTVHLLPLSPHSGAPPLPYLLRTQKQAPLFTTTPLLPLSAHCTAALTEPKQQPAPVMCNGVRLRDCSSKTASL
jgi:hypothetical protein